MKLVDSHCHLDGSAFSKDRRETIDRFEAAGGVATVIAGIDEKSSRSAIQIADKNESIFTSVGIHPHDAVTCNDSTLSALKTLSRHPKVKAWGEIGLDFNRMYSPQKIQEEAFIAQLTLADALKLPIIFHERDTNGRFLDILKAHPNPSRKGVIHCFSGNREELEQYLALGFYIGVTGIVTLKKRGALLRKLVPDIPSKRLLVETDAPYLTPAPEKNRTRRNEPAFVRSVLLKVAAVKEEDPEELSEVIWRNTCRLFDLQNK
jgi:TatD DNase family protein